MGVYERYMETVEKISRAAAASGRNEKDISLVGASKMQSVEIINKAIDAGLRIIGENRAQELLEKCDLIKRPSGFETHFIGKLQRNKVKYIIDKVSLIHSVDSLSLLEEISRQAVKRSITMPVLMQINIAQEKTKSGFLKEEIYDALIKGSKVEGVKISGLMVIPPPPSPGDRNGRWFEETYNLFVDIKGKKYDNVRMDILSMGMSGDFETAILCGSNMVRVGTALFGNRNYL